MVPSLSPIPASVFPRFRRKTPVTSDSRTSLVQT
jgi:hypothetical protein